MSFQGLLEAIEIIRNIEELIEIFLRGMNRGRNVHI